MLKYFVILCSIQVFWSEAIENLFAPPSANKTYLYETKWYDQTVSTFFICFIACYLGNCLSSKYLEHV